jgi:hypothetical protein
MSVIDRLASTPEILRLLMEDVPEDLAVEKPAPDRWSLAEVLEHLSHVEGHVFRARLDLILEEDEAEVIPYDEKEYDAAGTYSGRDPEESFAHWEEQREDAVELLRDLPEEAFERTAVHPELGPFTLNHLLHDWVCHDLGHVRQIAELVRAGALISEAGPFAETYTLRP